MSGVEIIPIRWPDEYDAKFMEIIFREVLAKADVRNAIGIGLSVTGTSDEFATISGASGDAAFVVITSDPNLSNERILAIEASVLTLTDNGPESTVEIGVAAKGISFGKIQDVSATDKLLGRSTAGAGVIEEIILTSAGRDLIDDASAAVQRTTLGVDPSGTDNSTDVTLAGSFNYLTITTQTITLNAIDLTADVTGDLPVADGGTGSSTASGARTNLGLGTAAVENIGTSGANVPLMSTSNTWTLDQKYSADIEIGGPATTGIPLNVKSTVPQVIRLDRTGSTDTWDLVVSGGTFVFAATSGGEVWTATSGGGLTMGGPTGGQKGVGSLNVANGFFANGIPWDSGSGDPEGVLTAPVSSLWSRTDGGTGTSFYVKESGTGNTGWVAK